MSSVEIWYQSKAELEPNAQILSAIRSLMLHHQLEEQLKWKQPVYMNNGHNLLMVSLRQHQPIISFFKGTLLHDPKQLLESAGPNSRHVKYLKIKTLQEFEQRQEALYSWIKEAIQLAEQQIKVPQVPVVTEELAELQAYFDQDLGFQSAFNALTPGRQRGYRLFFSQAKQSSTRHKRIKRYRERIVAGYGLHDCTCGLSQRLPQCDGSHKLIT